jgi:hypothetical protein
MRTTDHGLEICEHQLHGYETQRTTTSRIQICKRDVGKSSRFGGPFL